MQYWIRITLFYCGHNTDESIRIAACNFLFCLMRSCYHYFGSFTIIATTILAVMEDVLQELLEHHSTSIKTFSDEDKVLSYFYQSLQLMKQMARERIQQQKLKQKQRLDQQQQQQQQHSSTSHTSNYSISFCSSLLTLFHDIEVVFNAHEDLRRHLTLPVVYDFYGVNLLDGPFDGRTTELMQNVRQRRKVIVAESGDTNNHYSKQCSRNEEVTTNNRKML